MKLSVILFLILSMGSANAQPGDTVTIRGDNLVYSIVEVMPKFPGGQDALMKYLGSIT